MCKRKSVRRLVIDIIYLFKNYADNVKLDLQQLHWEIKVFTDRFNVL